MARAVNIIEKRLEQLRDQVNAHRRQELLLAVPMAWNALCAAMDAVGDVELGIAAFQSGKVPAEIGHTYLATYGLMQMLYVQQDAMNVIRAVVGTETVPASRKALGEAIKSQQDHMLAPIRQRRNRAVGHPMTNDGRASFIVRVSLSARGFTVYSVGDSHEFETQRVDLVADIAAQQRQVAKSLGDLVKRLKTSEIAHRRAHRGVKLAALVPETVRRHDKGTTSGASPRRARDQATATN